MCCPYNNSIPVEIKSFLGLSNEVSILFFFSDTFVWMVLVPASYVLVFLVLVFDDDVSYVCVSDFEVLVFYSEV